MHASPSPSADPASPCTGVCRLNAGSGRCEGCARTLAEIAAWPTLSVTDKRALLVELAGRGVS